MHKYKCPDSIKFVRGTKGKQGKHSDIGGESFCASGARCAVAGRALLSQGMGNHASRVDSTPVYLPSKLAEDPSNPFYHLTPRRLPSPNEEYAEEASIWRSRSRHVKARARGAEVEHRNLDEAAESYRRKMAANLFSTRSQSPIERLARTLHPTDDRPTAQVQQGRFGPDNAPDSSIDTLTPWIAQHSGVVASKAQKPSPGERLNACVHRCVKQILEHESISPGVAAALEAFRVALRKCAAYADVPPPSRDVWYGKTPAPHVVPFYDSPHMEEGGEQRKFLPNGRRARAR